MISLILKDFLVQKKTLIFSIIYLLIFSFFFKQTPNAMFPTAITVLTYMVVMTSCSYDDKYNSDILFNSIPLGRTKIVVAKYVSSYVTMIIAGILYTVLVIVINSINLSINLKYITWDGIAAGFLSVTLIIGIYLPAFFKVGYTKARILNLILFFAVFFGVSFLGQQISGSESSLSLGIIEFIKAQSDFQIIFSVFLFGILTLFISLFISIILYKNREF